MCITVKQMMQIEENGHQMGFSRKFMMENAGAAAAKRIEEKYPIDYLKEGVLVFAGTAMMQTGRAIEIVSITMLTYLSLSIAISIFMNWYNKKIAIKEK